jgi:hypothetical protein
MTAPVKPCPQEELMGISNECTKNCPNRKPDAELLDALKFALVALIDYGASKYRKDVVREALRKAGAHE